MATKKTPAADATTNEPTAGEGIAGSQVHTYEDGSSVVGSPPWPEKSPKQRAAEAAALVKD